MSSRKLQAYGFIRRYFSEHHGSPTYGEIAAGLGVSRQRAYGLVRELEIAGKLTRAGGARGIRLILPPGVDDVDAAIALLKARGFRVDEEGLGLLARVPLTTTPLPMLPDLSHIPDVDFVGGGHAGIGAGTAAGRAPGAGAAQAEA